jgi:hypothetical protein
VSIVPIAADSVPNASVINELRTALDSPPGLIFDTQMNSHIFSQNRTNEQTSQHRASSCLFALGSLRKRFLSQIRTDV